MFYPRITAGKEMPMNHKENELVRVTDICPFRSVPEKFLGLSEKTGRGSPP
jgi:hypothetical protein